MYVQPPNAGNGQIREFFVHCLGVSSSEVSDPLWEDREYGKAGGDWEQGSEETISSFPNVIERGNP